jgi:hypothetical protein
MVDYVFRPPKPTITSGLEHAVTHAVADMLISVKETIERIHSIQHEIIYLILPRLRVGSNITVIRVENGFKDCGEIFDHQIFN